MTNDRDDLDEYAQKKIIEIKALAIAANACPKCHAPAGARCIMPDHFTQIHTARL